MLTLQGNVRGASVCEYLCEGMRKDTDKINAENRYPNQDFTVVELLQSCAKKKDVCRGTRIHVEVLKRGLLEKSPYIATTLIHMYVKCGLFSKAKQVFEELSTRDVAPWTSLIGGYVQDGQSHEAIDCFYRMQSEGLYPNEVTFICILKACGSVQSMDNGKRVHDAIVSRGLLEKNAMLGNALVHMYAKCGDFVHAYQVLRDLPSRDEVSWSILILGYVQEGLWHEALHCHAHMQRDGFFPNVVTFVYLLKACGRIGAIEEGQRIHNEITARRLLDTNIVLGNALLDMYPKCGELTKVQEVFNKLPVRDIMSWNALLIGYGNVGESKSVSYIFSKLICEYMKPCAITLLSLLNVCNHGGLLHDGLIYFEMLGNDYNLDITIDHYACIADLFARAGYIYIAIDIVENMPLHPDIAMWHMLLAACWRVSDVELGREVFGHVIELDEEDISSYVCLSNMYADVAMQEEANKISFLRV